MVYVGHGKKNETTCKNCHSLFYVRISEVNRGFGQFCSKICRNSFKKPILDRFFKRVDKTETCWLWTGLLTKFGYGQFQIWTGEGNKRKNIAIHRFSYTVFKGPIPDGYQVDHLCKNRSCVNPIHLEAVTPRQNILRSDGVASKNYRKKVCKRGHEFTPENIYPGRNGSRHCRICKNWHWREWKRKSLSK